MRLRAAASKGLFTRARWQRKAIMAAVSSDERGLSIQGAQNSTAQGLVALGYDAVAQLQRAGHDDLQQLVLGGLEIEQRPDNTATERSNTQQGAPR